MGDGEPAVPSLSEQVRALEEAVGCTQSDRIEAAGRSVATLRD